MAEAHHTGHLAQPQGLFEQTLESYEEMLPELAHPAVVRLLIDGQHPNGQILVTGPLDLAGGGDAQAVGINQQHRHHPRVEPLLPAWILGLRRDQDLREILFFHQVLPEIHLVILSQPITC